MPLNWYLEGLSWYLEALKKYAVFSGRARRKEFWWFYLFNMLAILTLSLADHFMRTNIESLQIGVLTGIYCLAIAIPQLVVSVRRLHDTGSSGWWVLLGAIPGLGAIILLAFMLPNSEPDPNEYGPLPDMKRFGTLPHGLAKFAVKQ